MPVVVSVLSGKIMATVEMIIQFCKYIYKYSIRSNGKVMQYSSNLLILSLDCIGQYVAIGLTSIALLISVCLNVVFCLLRRKENKYTGMPKKFDFYRIYKKMNYDKSTTT